MSTMHYISASALHAALILTIAMHDCICNSIRTQSQMKNNRGSETSPCEQTILLVLKQRSSFASEAQPESQMHTQISVASDQQESCLFEVSVQHSLHVVVVEGGEARLRDIDGDAKL